MSQLEVWFTFAHLIAHLMAFIDSIQGTAYLSAFRTGCTPTFRRRPAAHLDVWPRFLLFDVCLPPSLLMFNAINFFTIRLPKDTIPIREMVIASTASVLGGFGIVTLFCTVGVYV